MNRKQNINRLIILIAIIIIISSACSALNLGRDDSPTFLAEAEIIKSEELVQFGTVSLPTYAPFTVDEAYVDRFITGDFKLTSEGAVYENQENPEYWYFILGYRTSDKLTGMRLVIPGGSIAFSDELFDDYETIEFGEGQEGKYKDNGTTQFFAWKENGVVYELAFDMPNNATMPLEEIIKVVESFRPYNKLEE